MPSFNRVGDFLQTGLRSLPSFENVLNSYQTNEKSETYNQTANTISENFNTETNRLENVLNNQIFGSDVNLSAGESVYNNSQTFSEKEKLTEKNNSQSFLNEYRTSEKTLEKSGQNNVEINIDMTGMQNNITSTNDIDEFLSQLTTKLEATMKSSANGVHI